MEFLKIFVLFVWCFIVIVAESYRLTFKDVYNIVLRPSQEDLTFIETLPTVVDVAVTGQWLTREREREQFEYWIAYSP